MNCRVCGAEVEIDEQQCSKCMDKESKVQVLTIEERQDFSGITLEQNQQQEEGYTDYQANNAKQRMYTRQFSIGSTSLFTKLLLGIILAGVVFIALPIAIFFISIVGIITFIVRK